MGSDLTCEVAIVGGGLAGGLTAYALSVKRPELDVRLIEPGAAFGGNHIWSFFSADIAPEHGWLVAPFVAQSWPGYDVRFPRFARSLDGQYNSIRSDLYDQRLRAALPAAAPVRAAAVEVGPTQVKLDDGRIVRASGVIDARGGGTLSHLDMGWQKFVGLELRTRAPHGLERPIVMDATVPQIDGYRFVYVLPFGPDRLFVEDTYYSDGPAFDREALDARILAYAEANGWAVAEILHREEGALPVTMGGDFEGYWRSGGAGVAKIGVRAALFHPTTGYSLPDAVRTAARIAAMPDLSGEALHDALHEHARQAWARGAFYRLLDRMLFRAAEPGQRYKILQRFYTLSPALIGRFYAGRTSILDKVRILAGKPPVRLGRALAVLRET
jgi:lycopene beta-cyclase